MESIVLESLGTCLPKMVTELPGEKSKELMKLRETHVPSGVSHGAPVFINRGEGAMFEDVDGNVILDFVGGIGVLNIGYSNPEVTQVIKEQVDKYLHTSINVVQYEPYIRLAEKLNSISTGDHSKKTMFVNSGAEAVENAIKISRKYTNRTDVVVFTGAFHGRTNLTMGMTSKVKPYKHGFGPFTPNIHRAEFPYTYRTPDGIGENNSVEYYINQINKFFLEVVDPTDVAAIIIEPVQGEGGFIPVDIRFIKELRRICDENKIVLIADEIQTGYCRTGKMFATEYWAEEGIYPDIMTSAKSIAAGLPISAVTGRSEIMEASQVGGIGGTYSGNPVAAVAALKVIEIMERDNYAQKSMDIGDTITSRLNVMKEKYDIIGDIRGLGSMIGLELVTDRNTKAPASTQTKAIINECSKNGLIVLSAGSRGNVIRFLVPLCVTEEQLKVGLDILENAVKKIINE